MVDIAYKWQLAEPKIITHNSKNCSKCHKIAFKDLIWTSLHAEDIPFNENEISYVCTLGHFSTFSENPKM